MVFKAGAATVASGDLRARGAGGLRNGPVLEKASPLARGHSKSTRITGPSKLIQFASSPVGLVFSQNLQADVETGMNASTKAAARDGPHQSMQIDGRDAVDLSHAEGTSIAVLEANVVQLPQQHANSTSFLKLRSKKILRCAIWHSLITKTPMRTGVEARDFILLYTCIILMRVFTWNGRGAGSSTIFCASIFESFCLTW